VERLAAAAKEYSRSSTFQLCIRGDKSTLIGAAEEIDNSAAQVVFRQQDGSIKWLNTAGFAIRRAYAELLMPLFDERAIRAQDTLLLAKLLEKGQSPPRYLPGSIVFHSPRMTLLGYICKAYDEHVDSLKAYALMAQMNLTIRMSLQERGEILRHFWFKASQLRHGWLAFSVVITRYLIRMSARLLCFGTRKR
jgi:hypothetical protein